MAEKETKGQDTTGNKIIISEEVARDQIQQLLDYYDIDQNDIVVDQGPEAVETVLNRLIRAIRKGYLEVSISGDTIKVIQHLQKPMGDVSTIEYSELMAKHKLAMDGIGDNKGNARMHALMASLASVPAESFRGLKGVDLSVMERLAVLFMVV